MNRSPEPRKPLDWQTARERLARAAAAVEDGVRLSPERARQLLEERARLLGRVPAEATQAAEVLEVVNFRVAGERYAVGARHVREVMRRTEVTPVPGAPDFLAGVINLRGEILAVFEPRILFGLAEGGETKACRRPRPSRPSSASRPVTTSRGCGCAPPWRGWSRKSGCCSSPAAATAWPPRKSGSPTATGTEITSS
jgi:hypothetical protein